MGSFDGSYPHPDCSHDRALAGSVGLLRNFGHARAAPRQADLRDAWHVGHHRWFAHRALASPGGRVRPQGGSCQRRFLMAMLNCVHVVCNCGALGGWMLKPPENGPGPLAGPGLHCLDADFFFFFQFVSPPPPKKKKKKKKKK